MTMPDPTVVLALYWVAGGVAGLHLAIHLVERRRHGLRWLSLFQALHLLLLIALGWAATSFSPLLTSQNIWFSLWGNRFNEALVLLTGFCLTV